MGPSYKNTERSCASDNDCSAAIGEICWWFYDGCTHGLCMCDPRTHFIDATGKCRKGKYYQFGSLTKLIFCELLNSKGIMFFAGLTTVLKLLNRFLNYGLFNKLLYISPFFRW